MITPLNSSLAALVFTWWMTQCSQAQAEDSRPKHAPAATQQKVDKPVQPGPKLDHAALAKVIDQEIKPAPPRVDDGEFLRRLYADLLAVIPPEEKVAAFVKNPDPSKRSKVIDELLADARFGSHLGKVWVGLMIPSYRVSDRAILQKWLAVRFNGDQPVNKIVYELLTASGEQAKNPAVTYFIANPSIDKITDNVTRVFLGLQLHCGQCHRHPLGNDGNADFWGMAQFFSKVKVNITPPPKGSKEPPLVSVLESAMPAKGKDRFAVPDLVKRHPAKFLHGEKVKLNPDEPARPVLAGWLTSATNPFFGKAMVNRFWYQTFGRGLLDGTDLLDDWELDKIPDEQGKVNALPAYPELLATLAEQFTRSNFDIKYLLRAICNSEAYQRTSRLTGGKGDSRVGLLRLEPRYNAAVIAAGKS